MKLKFTQEKAFGFIAIMVISMAVVLTQGKVFSIDTAGGIVLYLIGILLWFLKDMGIKNDTKG